MSRCIVVATAGYARLGHREVQRDGTDQTLAESSRAVEGDEAKWALRVECFLKHCSREQGRDNNSGARVQSQCSAAATHRHVLNDGCNSGGAQDAGGEGPRERCARRRDVPASDTLVDGKCAADFIAADDASPEAAEEELRQPSCNKRQRHLAQRRSENDGTGVAHLSSDFLAISLGCFLS